MKIPRQNNWLAVVACGILLLGCGKQAPEPTQEAPQSSNTDAVRRISTYEVKQLWQPFLQRVADGTATDPYGQYVSKKEQWSGKGERPSRPKINYQERTAFVNEGGVIVGKIACEDRPEDPDCIIVPPPPMFVSTEGMTPYSGADNPNGYIYDLKLVSNSGVVPNVPPNYTRLNLDLNDQAGGHYIYLTFTRKPADVLNGLEYHQNKPYSSGPVTGITVKTGGSNTNPEDPPSYYNHIWGYNGYGYSN